MKPAALKLFRNGGTEQTDNRETFKSVAKNRNLTNAIPSRLARRKYVPQSTFKANQWNVARATGEIVRLA